MWSTVVVALATGCASSGNQQESAPANVVLIPQPTEEQTRAAEETPPPPPREHPSASDQSPDEEEVAEEEIRPNPWGSSAGAMPSGGPDCDRAADCCMKLLQRSSGAQGAALTCDMFRTAPSRVCMQLLSTLRNAAQQAGVICN